MLHEKQYYKRRLSAVSRLEELNSQVSYQIEEALGAN